MAIQKLQKMNHDSIHNYVEFYLEKLKAGDFDAAFHGLTESDHAVIPILIEAFQKESAPNRRSELIKIISEFRQPSTIPFLGAALCDSSAEVWKSALDGLVALSCPEAVSTLKVALTRHLPTPEENPCFREWVEEAIEQLLAKTTSHNSNPNSK